jgi:DedD protein
MPRNSVSDEEILLKKRARRRLIGAIVLVTLVIVLLPMFLDSEPRPLNQEISIQIPAQSTEFSSRVAALPKPAAPDSANAGAESKEPSAPKAEAAEPEKKVPNGEPTRTEAEKPRAPEPARRAETENRARDERTTRAEAPAKPAPKPETKPQPKPEAKSEAKPQPKPAADEPREKESGGEGFIVQVAALTDADKAKLLKGRISESGMRADTEVVKTARGEVTRVRVGPYASKEAAQKAADELKKLGLSGVVAPRG